MSDVREATATLVADRPELEEQLYEVLKRDTRGPWEFDDIPLDSGTFGELVSRGVVEKVDSKYRLANPEAVRAALAGEDVSAVDRSSSFDISLSDLGSVDTSLLFSLIGALLLLLLLRLLSVPAVLQESAIVLSGNDPYYYRYLVEETLRSGMVPGPARTGEPLLVAVLAAASSLAGGLPAVGAVLAWYPPLAALICGILVYVVAVRVSDDQRVGIAAVVMLAIVPAHAYRTGFGFADHHAFDYVWLATTLTGLVLIADWSTTDIRRLSTLVGTVAVSLGVAGQLLAWDAGALLTLPLGAYVAVRSVLAVHNDCSPVARNVPELLAVGLAAGVVLAAHLVLGWHSTVVAFAPVLLFGGVVAVTALGELAWRQGYDARYLLGVEAALVAVTAIGVPLALPDLGLAVSRGLGFLFGANPIVENTSLFSGQLGTVVGPIFVFGFLFFIALPYLAWASKFAVERDTGGWLALSVYGWALIPLSVLQIRFGGELSLPLSVFAGVGLVHICAWIGVARPLTTFTDEGHGQTVGLQSPERRDVVSLLAVGGLTGGIGLIQTPVKTFQLTNDDGRYQLSLWMRDYAAERGWSYPQNYVLSQWGRNRVYNYFVNGQSLSYNYARENYTDFLASSDGDEWFDRFDGRVGFIVVPAHPDAGFAEDSLYSRLYTQWGSGDSAVSGTGHFRGLRDTGDRKVFTPTEGALLVGRDETSEAVTVSTEVAIDGAEFTYERTAAPGTDGWFVVRVPYPGDYTVGQRTVSVAEETVRRGDIAGEQRSRAHWPFDSGTNLAVDDVGGNHVSVGERQRTDGVDGGALSFQSAAGVLRVSNEGFQQGPRLVLGLWLRTDDAVDYESISPRLAGATTAGSYADTDGYQLGLIDGQIAAAVGDGNEAGRVVGPRVDDGEWHHVVLHWNGEAVSLYVDGDRAGRVGFDGQLDTRHQFGLGGIPSGGARFTGALDDVWLDTATTEDVADWSFGDVAGPFVFDPAGGNHAYIDGATATEGGDAVRFDGDDEVRTLEPFGADELDAARVTAQFLVRNVGSGDNRSGQLVSVGTDGPDSPLEGLRLSVANSTLSAVLGDGETVVQLEGVPVDDGEWHEATLEWGPNGIRLNLDGETVARNELSLTVGFDGAVRLGQWFDGSLRRASVHQP